MRYCSESPFGYQSWLSACFIAVTLSWYQIVFIQDMGCVLWAQPRPAAMVWCCLKSCCDCCSLHPNTGAESMIHAEAHIGSVDQSTPLKTNDLCLFRCVVLHTLSTAILLGSIGMKMCGILMCCILCDFQCSRWYIPGNSGKTLVFCHDFS